VDQDKTDRWKDLCRQAEDEKDPAKLLALVEEIDRLLEIRAECLKRGHHRSDDGAGKDAESEETD
jgi:hypothetical protein